MLKYILTASLITACFGVAIAKNDTLSYTKEGWNLGAVPAIGFDADLGFQLGAMASFFDYGNGSSFPQYDHSLFLMATAYTRGSTDIILFFDSFTLMPSQRFTLRASYNRNQAMPFYGFNGYKSVYQANWEDQSHPDYISRMFYNYHRSLINLNIDFQDTIAQTPFSWFVGWDFGTYKTKTVDISRLNGKKNSSDPLPNVPLLYDRYVSWGLIGDKEKDGGIVNSLKVGIVYDTREQLSNPMKGIWTEILFRHAPGYLGNELPHNKLSVIHRQYITLLKKKLSFAYRLWYFGTVGNNLSPFYARPYLTASNYYEGFGGVYTLRGVFLNRVIGEDFMLGNFELRWKIKYFNFLNNKWYVGINLFFDTGRILKEVPLNLNNLSASERSLYFSRADGQHSSVGMGGKLAMNENFVVSLDYGRAIDKRDGPGGMYVIMNYLF